VAPVASISTTPVKVDEPASIEDVPEVALKTRRDAALCVNVPAFDNPPPIHKS